MTCSICSSWCLPLDAWPLSYTTPPYHVPPSTYIKYSHASIKTDSYREQWDEAIRALDTGRYVGCTTVPWPGSPATLPHHYIMQVYFFPDNCLSTSIVTPLLFPPPICTNLLHYNPNDYIWSGFLKHYPVLPSAHMHRMYEFKHTSMGP